MIEDFFHLPPVSTTPVVHLELRIYQGIFKKIWNGPNGILRYLGETDSWKKPEVENLVTLSYKGTESRNFLFQVFHESSFPKPLKITASNFCENLLRYLQVKVHHRYQQHQWQIATRAANFATGTAGVVDTGGKFAISVNDTGGKFAAGVDDTGGNFPLMSTTPSVSTTPAAIRLLTP